MSPEQFQSELRSRCFRSTITVRRDPKWAREHGWHPDAYLCWDIERGTHQPHVFYICARGQPGQGGPPVEPCETIIQQILGQRIDRKFGGRGTSPGLYREAVLRREMERAMADDKSRELAQFQPWLDEDGEGKLQSAAKNEQRWTMDPTLQVNRGMGL